MRYLSFLLLGVVLLSFSCKNNNNDDDDDIQPSETKFIVINEGAFGGGNASLSYYDDEDGSVLNNVFHSKNGRVLGDVAQSAITSNDKLFVSLNASNKIEVANRGDVSELGVIKPISLPRYFAVKDQRVFVSSWGNNGQVYSIDATSYQVIDSVSVGAGPEQMQIVGNQLFVANSGGYASDSTVCVLDVSASSFQLTTTIEVGDLPVDMVTDGSGHVWVLCKGKTIYDASWQVIGHTPCELVEIDPTTNQVLATIPMFIDEHPSHLEISPDGTTVYIGGGFGFSGIYRLNLTGSSIVPMKIIDIEAYGFNVNPSSGEIFVLEAPDFSAGGNLKIYSTQGSLLETHTVGIGPNGVVF